MPGVIMLFDNYIQLHISEPAAYEHAEGVPFFLEMVLPFLCSA